VVDQPPEIPEASLENYLRKDESKNKSFVVQKETKGAVRAKLSYRMIASSDRYYLLEVELETGRHHQIRAQLAAIGCRIKGDLKYGFPRSNPNGSVHLHARRLEFTHPVKKETVSITAPCLDDPVWNYFEAAMQDKDILA